MSRDTIYELRMYTLHPGRRDELIELFEREFVESQEAVDARVVGTFRDLDRPDRFVWIRSFTDMTSRAHALQAFYFGPVWAAHRQAANATMIDSDNVLLLHSAGTAPPHPRNRPPLGAQSIPETVFVATIHPLKASGQEGPFAEYFTRIIAPAWREAGAEIVATFATEHSENNFPRLPIRENETVFVSLTRFATRAACEASRTRLESSPGWRDEIEPGLRAFLDGPAEILCLQPTARSSLR